MTSREGEGREGMSLCSSMTGAHEYDIVSWYEE